MKIIVLAGVALAAVSFVLMLYASPSRASATGTASDGAAAGVAGVAPGIVDAATARKLVEAGVKVVDVRTPAEFEAGHVPGAVNIPFDEVRRRAGEIGPPSTPVLLYCRSGRRTGIARRTLAELGYAQLYDLRSYELWVASEGAGTGR
jgi:rhodanese-related sulfurtransferase